MRPTFFPQPAGANAFESVRPRSAVAANDAGAPSVDVEPCSGSVAARPAGAVLLFNCRGLRTVGLAPRVQGAISIESRAQAQASLDKSRRIARDWRQQ